MRRACLYWLVFLFFTIPCFSQAGFRPDELSQASKVISQHIRVITKIQSFGYNAQVFPQYLAVAGNDGHHVVLGVLTRGKSWQRWLWVESKLDDEFAVSSPDDFAVIRLKDGADAVAYKGCASHLCGINGVSGVLLFVPTASYICRAQSLHGTEIFAPQCDGNPDYKAYVSQLLRKSE
jgi:hypothetical protein